MRPRLRLAAALAVLVAACGPSDAAPSGTSGPLSTAASSAPATTADTPTTAATPTVAAFAEVPDLHPSVDDWEAGTVEVVADDGTVHRVRVRVARTPDQRAHGLMEVPALPDGAGMWFVYDEDRDGGFWMKDTLVPLDITYVGADQRIVDVVTAEPCTADPCPSYPPEAPYRHVLEVPGGWLDEVGAGVGDVVRFVAG